MLKIPVVKGNLNRALKQFKKKFKQTKVLQELKDRKQYIKPSKKRRIQKDEAIRKLKKQQDDEQRTTRIKCRFQSNNSRSL